MKYKQMKVCMLIQSSYILNPSFKQVYPVITHAKGIYMYDDKGNQYIDGSSGAVLISLGHAFPGMGEVISEQAEKISFAYRWDCVTPVLEEACRSVCEASNGDLAKVFMVSGGSEATEIAIKLARKYFLNRGLPGKYKVISRWQSYHGSTMGALSISGFTARRAGYDPYLFEQGHIPPAYCYRCWYGRTCGKCDFECAGMLENEILCQGPDTVAAFIMEPVSGMSLCAAYPDAGYYQKIRAICDKYDVLLIDDEVMAGMGRTGAYYAYQHFDIVPDIIALGKALAGGAFPIGAVACTEKLYQAIYDRTAEFAPGYSWAGNPLGAAAVAKTFEILREKDLVGEVGKKGEYLKNKLVELAAEHPSIGDVRGIGLMLGLEFVRDKATKEPFPPELGFAAQFKKAAMEERTIFEVSTGCDRGGRGDTVMVAPAFIITYPEMDTLAERIGRALTRVERANGMG